VSRRVLQPSRRRNALRLVVGLVLCGVGAAMLATGFWGGLVLLAIGLWPLSMAALILFGPRAYELQLDERGFRVHDLFGRVVHDVTWPEVRALIAVGANAYSFIVVGWVLSPRRPKRGRWRWKRGTKDDDGCMPDTYGMKADELMDAMYSYAGVRSRTAPATGISLEPF
jgi:hypothetical protein